MRNFLSVAPGAIWVAIILGLSLGAIWLNDYMGDVVPAWLPPLILTVLVPVLKVFVPVQKVSAPGAAPAGRGEVGIQRSRFSRWLW